jgi:cellobiose-specific phosphotransferase system component IIC
MNDATIKLIEDLALKFGTTVEHLWMVLTKQAFLNAVSCCAKASIVLLLTFLWWKLLSMWLKKEEADQDIKKFCYNLSAVVTGVVLFFVFAWTDTAFTGFFNPEYWALQQILHIR